MNILSAAFLGLLAAAGQPDEDRFHREVLERLERIERLLRGVALPTSDRGPRERESITADTNVTCGVAPVADCQRNAQSYCANLQFARGVPIQIDRGGSFVRMTRVRCFN